MSQLLINILNRNGYQDGNVVHISSSTGKHGRLETPENGFVSIQVPDAPEETLRNKYLAGTETIPRTEKIRLNKVAIPLHPAAHKFTKAMGLRAGRSILPHLLQDKILKIRHRELL